MARERAEIVEVGLRDGLQMLPQVVPTTDKLRWHEAERAAGVSRFEVGSFVPAKYMPQMADTRELVGSTRGRGQIIAALAPNLKGAQAAAAAGVDVIVMPVSASAAHSQANVRRSPDEMVAQLAEAIAQAGAEGWGVRFEAGIATAFGCTLQGEVKESEVLRLAAAAAEVGADEIGLADTVGYATPAQVRRLFTRLRAEVGEKVKSAHFHDTRGMGLANVMAALEAGVRSFDASLGGLGGCPHAPGASGNIATEDLAFLLDSLGLETGIDLGRLLEAQRLLPGILPGQALFGKLGKAGLPLNYMAAA